MSHKFSKSIFVFVSILALLNVSCATKVVPNYISPNTYQSYNCSELKQEYKRIVTHINLIKKEKFNLATTGLQVGLSGNHHGIYPTFSIGIGKQQKNNHALSNLYGEHDAVVQIARFKSCPGFEKVKLFNEN